MMKQMDQLKKDREKQIGVIQDLRDNLDTLGSNLSEARGRKKAEIQNRSKRSKKPKIAETDKFKEMTARAGQEKG